ncbi:MAG: threo-3-hydroxy-L-aspartate ammonia-lyase [Gaiellales bacterium]|nr:threo-3-hydroxy-L-aspartate ammonia-lyase [Gaiellales bacterium]
MSDGPDLAGARARVEGHVWRTPALHVDALDLACGREIWLKPECLQRTGSFKFRGATNAVARLPEGTEGVVCISSGNHAQAVARAAREAGIRCLAVMPIDSNPTKIAATAGYAAEVEREGVTAENRERIGRARAAERGWPLIHPFDDWDVLSGQGTAALELLEDAPALDTIVTPIGGGGLLSGTALACAESAPQVAVWGAEPASGDDAYRSLAAGKRISLERAPQTLADGVRTLQVGERPFSILRERCAGIALVEEDALREALAVVWSRTKLVIEPTSALPIAAVLQSAIPGQRIGVILSGGNVDAARVAGRL